MVVRTNGGGKWRPESRKLSFSITCGWSRVKDTDELPSLRRKVCTFDLATHDEDHKVKAMDDNDPH
ncbi:uncharacterized protein G2W53_003285 [Senna tora]|uniref:Uncharacterized protein n=1 Tax=Senna tora TaxID=362788 RepID=A0A834XAL1_9FABA|nr:uncharacterized protein G2W53_003285 [Senna tora]